MSRQMFAQPRGLGYGSRSMPDAVSTTARRLAKIKEWFLFFTALWSAGYYQRYPEKDRLRADFYAGRSETQTRTSIYFTKRQERFGAPQEVTLLLA